MPPIVVPHDPAWAEAFRAESQRIKQAAGEALVTIHHIGSTSIRGIHAKPIIDMLGEAAGLAAVDAKENALIALGYEALGEFGIPRRRYFRKENADGMRTHHLHVFAAGDEQLTRHLAFRDYLRAHPNIAAEYSQLKCRLMAECAGDMERYMDGKDTFIKDVDRQAAAWRAEQ